MVEYSHFVWQPAPYVAIWGSLGVPVYVVATWVALLGGTVFWLMASRQLLQPWWKRFASLLIIFPLTILFTRLFHILFWGWEQTLHHPQLLFQLASGRSIHGTIAGFALAALVLARIWKIPVSAVATPLSYWALWALVCARIGNFWNSEMIGTPSDFPFAVGFYFSADHGSVARHPVQLYEAALALMLMGGMAAQRSRTGTHPFAVSAIALMGYGVIRFCCDFFRLDDGGALWPGISKGQALSVGLIAGGMLLAAIKREGNASCI